nr:MAG TPA: restriction alleviation protein [Caudoviricetes sp.]
MFELKPCPFCGGTKLKVERKSRLAGRCEYLEDGDGDD